MVEALVEYRLLNGALAENVASGVACDVSRR